MRLRMFWCGVGMILGVLSTCVYLYSGMLDMHKDA